MIRVFKDVDLIENIGFGVIRILEHYDKNCFKFMEHFLRVTFKYRENPFEYEIATTQKTTQNITQETTHENSVMLNENQIGIIRPIKAIPNITLKKISEELNLTRDGVKYNMNALKSLGIIERIGSDRKWYWKIIE